MGAYEPDSIVVGKAFKVEINGQFGEIDPTNQPTSLGPNVLPNPLEDVDGTFSFIPSTGTHSGEYALAASSWHDGNAFRFFFVVEPQHEVKVDSIGFFEQARPGGPTNWEFRINGSPVATGSTHEFFEGHISSFDWPALSGTNTFELVGLGATDPAALWAIDDLAVGTLVPEPTGLAIAGMALGSLCWTRFRHWRARQSRRVGSLLRGRRLAVRSGGASDLPLLESMLYEAMHWNATRARPAFAEARGSDGFRRWLEGWGRRTGDTAAVATVGGRPAGAAWYRYHSPEMGSLGYVDESIPEVCIGVSAKHRARRVGRTLLVHLIDQARQAGVGALSLSVERENHALKLYRRLGFREVGRAGNLLTMVREVGR